MSLTITFPDEQYTVNTPPEEGETIDLIRGLTLTRRNGILFIEGTLELSIQAKTVSVSATQ